MWHILTFNWERVKRNIILKIPWTQKWLSSFPHFSASSTKPSRLLETPSALTVTCSPSSVPLTAFHSTTVISQGIQESVCLCSASQMCGYGFWGCSPTRPLIPGQCLPAAALCRILLEQRGHSLSLSQHLCWAPVQLLQGPGWPCHCDIIPCSHKDHPCKLTVGNTGLFLWPGWKLPKNTKS